MPHQNPTGDAAAYPPYPGSPAASYPGAPAPVPPAPAGAFAPPPAPNAPQVYPIQETAPYGQTAPYPQAAPYQQTQPYQPTQPYPVAQQSYPAGYAAGPYAPYAPARPNSGIALAAMICGIAGIVLAPFTFAFVAPILVSIAAIVLGHIALPQLKKRPELGGKGMAITGLILGYIPVAIGIALIVFGIIAAVLFGATLLPFLSS